MVFVQRARVEIQEESDSLHDDDACLWGNEVKLERSYSKYLG